MTQSGVKFLISVNYENIVTPGKLAETVSQLEELGVEYTVETVRANDTFNHTVSAPVNSKRNKRNERVMRRSSFSKTCSNASKKSRAFKQKNGMSRTEALAHEIESAARLSVNGRIGWGRAKKLANRFGCSTPNDALRMLRRQGILTRTDRGVYSLRNVSKATG